MAITHRPIFTQFTRVKKFRLILKLWKFSQVE